MRYGHIAKPFMRCAAPNYQPELSRDNAHAGRANHWIAPWRKTRGNGALEAGASGRQKDDLVEERAKSSSVHEDGMRRLVFGRWMLVSSGAGPTSRAAEAPLDT